MEGSLRQIPLSEIGDTLGTPPSSALVGSVRRNGVVQPIVLAEIPGENGELRFRLIDGNRRVKAARSCGINSVPAIVFAGVDPTSLSTLTLILNGFRASNYLTEFWAIKQLERLGVNEAGILSISGLTRGKVNQRTNLSELNRDLFVALRNGKIFQTHAAAIAKLPEEAQADLAHTFQRNHRISQADIAPYKPRRSAEPKDLPISESIKRLAWSAQDSNQVDNTQPPPGSNQTQDSSHAEPSHLPTVQTPPESRQNQDQLSHADFSPDSVGLAPPTSFPEEHANLSDSLPGTEVSQDHEQEIRPASQPSISVSTAIPRAALVSDSISTAAPLLNSSQRLDSQIRNLVMFARNLDCTREELLDLVDRKWNEVESQAVAT